MYVDGMLVWSAALQRGMCSEHRTLPRLSANTLPGVRRTACIRDGSRRRSDLSVCLDGMLVRSSALQRGLRGEHRGMRDVLPD